MTDEDRERPTGTLEPALTASQWEIVDRRRLCAVALSKDAIPPIAAPVTEAERVMAIANDSLPADDPYKFTHADVKGLLMTVDRAMFAVTMLAGNSAGIATEVGYINTARTLAGKLRAILPPDAPEPVAV